MSGVVQAFAPAKVNLSLTVHGQRADGYHELTSLVAFADVGDTLLFTPADTFELRTSGPTATQIDGPNLIETAAMRLSSLANGFATGDVTLEKTLPVGAGMGGGSSDAAAYLRAARRANGPASSNVRWSDLALELGADVPVCLAGRTTWMCGIGETLLPLSRPLPPLHAVLVNPGVSVPTGPVFHALAAPVIDHMDRDIAATLPDLRNGLSDLMTLSNDLEAPALQLVPTIRAVRDALEASDGVRVVRMSGSGATYFGLYDNREAAVAAARSVTTDYPEWWSVVTTLGDAPSDDTRPGG